jgi:N-acetylglucosaminyldiphosphoundecaprenol N-acetyl-beta-D-mannosaminyltransferase
MTTSQLPATIEAPPVWQSANWTPPNFHILGVRVDAVQMADTVSLLSSWIDDPRGAARFVAVTGMHGIAESQQNPSFHEILNAADLVVPDGMPLIWVGRIYGHSLRHRVTGSELMEAFCEETGSLYRHFFFGGNPGVADKLARILEKKYGITVAGTYTPPFRPLTGAEDNELASLVERTRPDIFWVGLSTPKQEKWMFEYRHKLNVPVLLGVGAAFDMNSGGARRAPQWMQDNGLEWSYRLLSEPRRLWRRYLITIPRAVWSVSLELLNFARVRPTPWGRR